MPDLCFDGHHPVAQIQFEGRSLVLTLDTGATNSDLYPPFAAAFPRTHPRVGKGGILQDGGSGWRQEHGCRHSVRIAFQDRGIPGALGPASVLLTHTTESQQIL